MFSTVNSTETGVASVPNHHRQIINRLLFVQFSLIFIHVICVSVFIVGTDYSSVFGMNYVNCYFVVTVTTVTVTKLRLETTGLYVHRLYQLYVTSVTVHK
jgi:hypothetical protein